MVNVGVIGLGFMGRTHLAAYQAARAAGVACRVVAVADRNAQVIAAGAKAAGSAAGNFETGASGALFDPAETKAYVDARELLADPAVQLVSICTHTDTHVDLVLAALTAGKHVLCEKPVAVSSAEVARVAAAVKASGRLFMPAMCMRFWPGWAWLKERIVDGSLGKLTSLVFQRLGSPPDWGTEFYRDIQRTGGPLVDLHIHDADLVLWLLGKPASVVTRGTLMHASTLYGFAGGPSHVLAEFGQDHHAGFGFKMRYTAVFEKATADYDLAREKPLLLCRDGKGEAVELPAGSGYDGEVRHMVSVVEAETARAGSGGGKLAATVDDAVLVARLLEAERRSLESGQILHFS